MPISVLARNSSAFCWLITLSGDGMAAVDGLLLGAGVADGMLFTGAPGADVGGVSLAGGVVCDQAGALSAITIAADAKSRDFMRCLLRVWNCPGAGQRLKRRGRWWGRARTGPASAPLVKADMDKSFPETARQRVLKEADILEFLRRIDLTVPVTIVTARPCSKTQDANRRDEFCHHGAFAVMSTRSIAVDPFRTQTDRRMETRRKEDLWLVATALIMSIVVSFIAVVTLT